MKYQWVRRNELKKMEAKRVSHMRAQRVVRSTSFGWIRKMWAGLCNAIQFIADAVKRAAVVLVDFLSAAIPVVEYEQHRQLAVGISHLIDRKSAVGALPLSSSTGYATIGTMTS